MGYTTMEIEVDADLKERAEPVLAALGYGLEEVVGLFLEKCIEAGGIPFDSGSGSRGIPLREALGEDGYAEFERIDPDSIPDEELFE